MDAKGSITVSHRENEMCEPKYEHCNIPIAVRLLIESIVLGYIGFKNKKDGWA